MWLHDVYARLAPADPDRQFRWPTPEAFDALVAQIAPRTTPQWRTCALLVHWLRSYAAEVDRAPHLRGHMWPWAASPPHGFVADPRALAVRRRADGGPTALSTAWFEARRGKVTGSRWPELFDPYERRPLWASRDALFRSATGKLPSPFHGSAATRWGAAHEAVALDRYEELQGTLVLNMALAVDPQCPHVAATPDGIRLDRPTLVEIKCPFSRRDRGALRTHYWPQMQCQMGVTGATATDFVIFADDALDVVQVPADPRWYAECVDVVRVAAPVMAALANQPKRSRTVFPPYQERETVDRYDVDVGPV